MSATVVATVDASHQPPQVRIDLAGFTGASAIVNRVDTVSALAPVRGGGPVTLAGGGAVLYDVEAPWNTPLTYQVSVDGGLTFTNADPVTLSMAGAWLVHPGIPSESVNANVLMPIGDDSYPSGVGLHVVLGRATPIPVSDGVRKSATFSLTLWTETPADEAAMNLILSDLSPLLLQLAGPQTQGGDSALNPNAFLYRWCVIDTVTVSRVDMDLNSQWREFTLGATVVSRPAGDQVSERSYNDLLVYASYQALTQAFRTYRGVLTGIVGT